jgi:hypothetical protein
MSLISHHVLRRFTAFVAGDALSGVLDNIMRQHPTAAEARQGVEELLAQPAFDVYASPQACVPQWARHDWLSQSAHDEHWAWANALMDQAVSADLTTLTGPHCLKAGHVLLEALASHSPDPRLVARLWAFADVAMVVKNVCETCANQKGGSRSLRQADRVALWLVQRPEHASALAAVCRAADEEEMPLYSSARLAIERQAQTPALDSAVSHRQRFRS